jgi:hypothetical protein
MPHAKRIILNCPTGCSDDLGPMVEDFLRDGVLLICAMGPDASRIEDAVDWFLVGDGSDDTRFIPTSLHRDESLEDVIEFARSFASEDGDHSFQVIELAEKLSRIVN